MDNTNNKITIISQNTQKLLRMAGKLNAYVNTGLSSHYLDEERLKKEVETIIQYVLAIESEVNPQ